MQQQIFFKFSLLILHDQIKLLAVAIFFSSSLIEEEEQFKKKPMQNSLCGGMQNIYGSKRMHLSSLYNLNENNIVKLRLYKKDANFLTRFIIVGLTRVFLMFFL